MKPATVATRVDKIERRGKSKALASSANLAGFVVSVAISALLLWGFHDKGWLASDDGFFAYVAERVLNGDVLSRDIHGYYAGYVFFAHAAALWLFGLDLVSLRYPLVVLGVVQAGLMYWLLAPRGAAVAIIGAVALTAFSFIQFTNPTGHWYVLFLAILIICVMTWMPPGRAGRVELLGFLVMTAFMFRQLSGIFVGMGVVSALLIELPTAKDGRDRILSRALVLAMLFGLVAFLAAKSKEFSIIAFGLGPIFLLILLAWLGPTNNESTRHLLARLVLGAVAAALPLVAYHALSGSLLDWWRDCVVSAYYSTDVTYHKGTDHFYYVLFAMRNMYLFNSFTSVINSIYWTIITLIPFVLAIFLLLSIIRNDNLIDITKTSANIKQRQKLTPLSIIALFYSLEATYINAPPYIYFVLGLAVCAIIWCVADGPTSPRRVVLSLTVALVVIAVYYHAGRPGRGYLEVPAGVQYPMAGLHDIGRASLYVYQRDVEFYRKIARLIEEETDIGDGIIGLPIGFEINFLFNRRNPLWFTYAPASIFDGRQRDRALDVLRRDPPRLAFLLAGDAFDTPLWMPLKDYVRQNYDLFERGGGYEIYRRRPRDARDSRQEPRS